MDEVALDLDPAMIDNMRREAEDHEFDDLDGYVQWLLERRDTVLNEYDVWENPPGAVEDPDADLAQSSSDSLTAVEESGSAPSLDPEDEGDAGFEFPEDDADADSEDEEDIDLPEEDGADDDDVAEALSDLELDDE
jgi:hypothetical protein